MPLSLTLIVRPSRAAAIAALAAAVCLVDASIAVTAGTGLEAAARAAALVATAWVVGLLAPIHGRGARAGLAIARGGILFAAGAAAVSTLVDGRWLMPVTIIGLLATAAGLRLLGSASRVEPELPHWSHSAVLVGIGAAVLFGGIGGVVILAAAWLAVAWAILDSTRSTAVATAATA